MSNHEERDRQVLALHDAINFTNEGGLPIVILTPHTAQCVLHYIDALEEDLVANKHINAKLQLKIGELNATIETWKNKVAFLDGAVNAADRKIIELNKTVDDLLDKVDDLEDG